MTLQNTRSLLFRGEDLSFGGASPKEAQVSTTTPATARPVIISLGFYGSTAQMNGYLGTMAVPTSAMAGLNRLIVNRSTRYWISLTAQLGASNSGLTTSTITIPIAPRQAMFLPSTLFATTASLIATDSAWPLFIAPNQAAGVLPPTAGQTTMVNLDFIAEQ